jgi:hypothetical protein
VSLVPIYCVACARFSLLPSHVVHELDAPLCGCGAEARFLDCMPCARGDRWLFEAVADAIESSGVTPASAARLRAEVKLAGGTAESLGRLRKLVPALATIQLIAELGEETRRKAVSFVETLLEALSKTRSQSGLFFNGELLPRARNGRD